MNERIKQLAEQAEVWNTSGDADKCEVDLEKFAELIVKECAEIARVYSEEGVEYNGGDAIKEHFGVE